MVASPYYVPDYFAPSFFDGSFTPAPPPVAGAFTPYDAPMYFAPSFFNGLFTPAPPLVAGATMPYDAPTYFAPSYFNGVFTPAPPIVAGAPTPYDTPTYFAPSYFFSGPSATVPISPPVPSSLTVPPGRDQAAYFALLGLLSGTGAFDEVIFGDATQRNQAGADSYPLAVVTPKGWEESDDFDPTLIVRRTSFAITLVVKSPNSGTQFGDLDQLSAIVQGVIDWSDLGGTCLSPLSKIKSGHYDKTTHFPEQSVELDGEFASLFDPLAPLPATSTHF